MSTVKFGQNDTVQVTDRNNPFYGAMGTVEQRNGFVYNVRFDANNTAWLFGRKLDKVTFALGDNVEITRNGQHAGMVGWVSDMQPMGGEMHYTVSTVGGFVIPETFHGVDMRKMVDHVATPVFSPLFHLDDNVTVIEGVYKGTTGVVTSIDKSDGLPPVYRITPTGNTITATVLDKGFSADMLATSTPSDKTQPTPPSVETNGNETVTSILDNLAKQTDKSLATPENGARQIRNEMGLMQAIQTIQTVMNDNGHNVEMVKTLHSAIERLRVALIHNDTPETTSCFYC